MTRATAAPAAAPARPTTARLVVDQLVHSTRDLWRARVVFVFTFLFPLTWLVVIGFLAGNAVVDEASGVRVMQFVTPTAAAMGVLFAAFPTVATALALAREQKVLERVRGTPLPAGAYLAGRIGGAVVFALGSVLTMLLVGVVVYGVQVVWRTAPATVVTVIAAIACFAALGLAVASVAPSAGMAQAASIAVAVVLGFLSGMYTVGELPGWASRLASVFPLKPFVEALREQSNPFHPGSGWDPGALAVLAAWGLAATLVAVRAFRWEPMTRSSGRSVAAPVVPASPLPASPVRPVVPPRVAAPGRPTTAALLLAQLRWALRTAWRDPGSVFFAVAVPVGLFAFMMAISPDGLPTPGGAPFGLHLAAGMTAWGAAVTAFVNMPGAVAVARDRGVLRRLHGTPLRPAVHLAGQTAGALLSALVTAGLVVTVGVVAFGLRIAWAGIPLAVAVLVLGTCALAACGFALIAVLPTGKAVTAVGLGILLPLSFFSDVFPTGDTPEWMRTVGAFLPLQHLAGGVAAALDPGGPSVRWVGLGVMAAWLAAAAAVAVRGFRWDGRGAG